MNSTRVTRLPLPEELEALCRFFGWQNPGVFYGVGTSARSCHLKRSGNGGRAGSDRTIFRYYRLDVNVVIEESWQVSRVFV